MLEKITYIHEIFKKGKIMAMSRVGIRALKETILSMMNYWVAEFAMNQRNSTTVWSRPL